MRGRGADQRTVTDQRFSDQTPHYLKPCKPFFWLTLSNHKVKLLPARLKYR